MDRGSQIIFELKKMISKKMISSDHANSYTDYIYYNPPAPSRHMPELYQHVVTN